MKHPHLSNSIRIEPQVAKKSTSEFHKINIPRKGLITPLHDIKVFSTVITAALPYIGCDNYRTLPKMWLLLQLYNTCCNDITVA
jgi:hypothetical protein